MHAQLTYKQNEKKYIIYKHTLQFSLVVFVVLLQVGKAH